MKLIELEDSNGEKYYINPEYVTSVRRSEFNDSVTVISIRGETLRLSGDARKIAEKIVHGYSI